MSIPKQKLRRFNSRQKFKGSSLIFVTFCQIVVANSHCFTRRLRSVFEAEESSAKPFRVPIWELPIGLLFEFSLTAVVAPNSVKDEISR